MSDYETEEVRNLAGEFRYRAKSLITDLSKQKDEAFNIGVAPQTLNNWLNYGDMPAFALSKVKCGRILLAYLEQKWLENFKVGGTVEVRNLSEIIRKIIELIGAISSIASSGDTTKRSEALDDIQQLKDLIPEMEAAVNRIFEKI